ncbi:Na+/H+ antiporter subunit E [Magnetospira thiophila]
MDSSSVSRTRYSFELFLTLVLFWILLNGNLAADTLLIGVMAALVITFFFRNGLSFLSDYRFLPGSFVATVFFVLYFFKELVKSNINLALIVLSPSLPVRPGIVKVRTRLKSRMGRLMLANAITLTPGTLTVGLEDEWLYIHWVSMESADIDQATESIVAGFERYLEVMYG